MRNGVNDSQHRGVWFYLGFLHPWAPEKHEIVVELNVVESSIHKSSKEHLKYCAPENNPGEISKLTEINAIHVPLEYLDLGMFGAYINYVGRSA